MLRFFKKGLKKTHEKILTGLNKMTFLWEGGVTEEALGEVERILIETDMGVETVLDFIDQIRSLKGNPDLNRISEILRDEFLNILGTETGSLKEVSEGPLVVLLIGVNGTGKTTTIAKIAHEKKSEGKKVILAACDTFRAAAVEQLNIWGRKIGVESKKGEGANFYFTLPIK